MIAQPHSNSVVSYKNNDNLVGKKISQYFETRRKFFTGTIVSQEYVKNKKTKKLELSYHIVFEDKDKEDLTKEEIDSYVKEGVMRFVE